MGKVFTLPLQKENTCASETFRPNAHPQHLRAAAQISKIGWIPFGHIRFLLAQCTGWKLQISNVVDAQSFHLAIAQVKYLHAWNLPPKCPPSRSSSWGKDFENRLRTFGDIGFLLAQYTGWKLQYFKCCQCTKFSHRHCKRKIHAQLKLSTQMLTLKIFELRQRFRNSVEI